MIFNLIPLSLTGSLSDLLSSIETNRIILNGATWKAIVENKPEDVVSIAEFLEEINFIEKMAKSAQEGQFSFIENTTTH